MKKINRVLNSIMLTSVTVTLARLIVDYIDLMILRPEVYAMRSAPWYVAGIVYGAVTLVLILICIVLKIIIKCKSDKNK